MAFLDEEFSVDTLPKGTSNFEPLPEGWYNATITGAEVKDTKAGDGKYIACKYTVTGPSHQGRVVLGNLIGGNLGIKLTVKTGDYVGNEIKGYRALGGAASTAAAPFKSVAPSTTPAKAAPPWAKK